ncbi:competence type IV pilus minor pilin ComGF [Alkalihalobacterium chitinilyticum]|uniref:Competence type IV pilus minor pilin ComGF n=1 Tax=Alkalihalobacterium chitinilyticum TaxID=2980103 RepID=A0ABT5VA05_9BACI|nr:competence type IV pilus minor pilin ComGF [Alkalihalobacterium chitinilyticum]MDE5412285.1 competence type IV pilus minor pilin ComGF [Alkalihalobacterium chitinilyticum]
MRICQKINQRGFTFIEVIIAFTLLLIIASVFPLVIKSIPILPPPTEQPHKFQVELFFNQFSMEVRETSEIEVTGDTLKLRKPDGTVTSIEKHGKLIRRRVNQQGHDVFLRHVSSVSYQLVPHGVIVEIVDTNRKRHERRFSFVCSLEVNS